VVNFCFFSTFRYFVAVISDCGDSAASAAPGEMKLPQNVCHFYSLPLHFFLWPLRGVLHVRVWVVLCAAKVEVFNELKFGTCVLGMDGKTSEICYTKLWLWRLWLCTALMRSAQRMRLCALRFNDGFASFQGISHLAMMAIKWLNHATSLSLSNGKHVN